MKKEKLTEELLQELISKPNLEDFIENEDLHDKTFADYLNELSNEKNLTCKDIIHKTNINETHAYQMFSGDRGAGRDTVLQIAFAMNLSIKECNRLLHSAGVSALYCKNRRDAIIVYCLTNNYSVNETNDELYKFNEETI